MACPGTSSCGGIPGRLARADDPAQPFKRVKTSPEITRLEVVLSVRPRYRCATSRTCCTRAASRAVTSQCGIGRIASARSVANRSVKARDFLDPPHPAQPRKPERCVWTSRSPFADLLRRGCALQSGSFGPHPFGPMKRERSGLIPLPHAREPTCISGPPTGRQVAPPRMARGKCRHQATPARIAHWISAHHFRWRKMPLYAGAPPT